MSGHASRPSAAAPSPAPIRSNVSGAMTFRRNADRRAIPSSSRSSSSGSIRAFESEPMQMGMPRSRTRSTGKYPSPRFASVVGQTQMREPLWARRSSSASSACVAWTTVVRGPRQPFFASSSIGPDPVLLDAFLDLARLLVGVDVQREIVLGGVAADPREPPRWAGADGVGGEADPDPAFPQVLDLVQVLGRRGLAEAGEPASRVGGVEEDEGDSRGCRGLGCCERLLKAEVVELADRGVAGGTHLAGTPARSRCGRARTSGARRARASRRARSRSRRPRFGP